MSANNILLIYCVGFFLIYWNKEFCQNTFPRKHFKFNNVCSYIRQSHEENYTISIVRQSSGMKWLANHVFYIVIYFKSLGSLFATKTLLWKLILLYFLSDLYSQFFIITYMCILQLSYDKIGNKCWTKLQHPSFPTLFN